MKITENRLKSYKKIDDKAMKIDEKAKKIDEQTTKIDEKAPGRLPRPAPELKIDTF